jgi:hypothetical protein|tara:strand:+ start:505 stop:828 length:324 start_codon:yes stop_codon:yes gene_type:complete
MKNLKLTDKELILIINALTDQIRYKGVQKLLVNMQNQLQEQDELVYVINDDVPFSKEKIGHIFRTEKELIDWLRGRGIEGTDEYIINESVQIGEVKQIKRSELTDTE